MTRYRIEPVSPEAIAAGYSPGWHVFIDGEYVQTYATRQLARDAVRRFQRFVGELPPE